jgi:hypothetical protein
MGVAMPISMIIEEAPIYRMLAKNTLYFTHLPANFLQDNVHYLNPIESLQFRIFY